MQCPKCGSDNVKIEIVTEHKTKQKKKGLLYWVTIGWFVEPLLWLFLTLPKLVYELFKPKRYKTKTQQKKWQYAKIVAKPGKYNQQKTLRLQGFL